MISTYEIVQEAILYQKNFSPTNKWCMIHADKTRIRDFEQRLKSEGYRIKTLDLTPWGDWPYDVLYVYWNENE